MSATVTKAGPYYTSGSISFSSLRTNFRAQQPDGSFSSDTLPIKASQLRRITSTSDTEPVVPDATENANITTSSNWKASQFRNSIKYYYITQTGTDDNVSSPSSPGFNIGTQTWNSNLNKNVRKYMYLNGTMGSSNINQPAVYLLSETHNLRVNVAGGIYGAGGAAGISTTSPSGGNGGPALYVQSTGSEVVVEVSGSANIYGGGGGGEKGAYGAVGTSGTCYSVSFYTTGTNCGGCPGCSPGYAIGYNQAGGNNCNCGKGGCSSKTCSTNCRVDTPYSVPGAPGGEGGNGGVGRGYNQSRTDGTAGSPGTTGGCPSFGGDGLQGETGGNGGDWGVSGGNTSNTGAGGSNGRAITGSNYSVTGTINSGTIKGQYQP
jgi:hypothetical protein